MPERTNKASARSYFESVLNAGDLDVAEHIFANEVLFHYPMGELRGLDSVKQYIGAVRTAFPDIAFKIEDLFGENDRVACRWTLKGTQTGEFRGNPPSGKTVQVPGNTIFQFSDGKIEELWITFDPSLLV